MNPVLQVLGNKNGLGQIINLIGSIKAASDPAAALQLVAQKNPIVKQALDIVRQNGGDARAAFQNTAQQYGADPNEIMNQLKGI